MTLYDCPLGQNCRIIGSVSNDKALKERLISFGITKGKKCQIANHSPRKLGVAILLDGVLIALRDSEAKRISIELL